MTTTNFSFTSSNSQSSHTLRTKRIHSLIDIHHSFPLLSVAQAASHPQDPDSQLPNMNPSSSRYYKDCSNPSVRLQGYDFDPVDLLNNLFSQHAQPLRCAHALVGSVLHKQRLGPYLQTGFSILPHNVEVGQRDAADTQ